MLLKFPVSFTFKRDHHSFADSVIDLKILKLYISLCSQAVTLLIQNSLFRLCSTLDTLKLLRFSFSLGSANTFQHWLPPKTTSPSPFVPLPWHRYTPSFLWQGNVVTQTKTHLGYTPLVSPDLLDYRTTWRYCIKYNYELSISIKKKKVMVLD